jgi:hypothetical protein
MVVSLEVVKFIVFLVILFVAFKMLVGHNSLVIDDWRRFTEHEPKKETTKKILDSLFDEYIKYHPNGVTRDEVLEQLKKNGWNKLNNYASNPHKLIKNNICMHLLTDSSSIRLIIPDDEFGDEVIVVYDYEYKKLLPGQWSQFVIEELRQAIQQAKLKNKLYDVREKQKEILTKRVVARTVVDSGEGYFGNEAE